MIDVTLLLVPLLVLPIVLLFRFIGCGFDGVATGELPPPPNYRDYIMSDPKATAPGTVRPHPDVHPNVNDVVGYWRLVDPRVIIVSGSTERTPPAKDERGFNDGTYFSATIAPAGPDLNSTPPRPGSEGSAPPPLDAIQFGNVSLIDSDPVPNCRLFSGGYVAVPDQSKTHPLYSQEFTIEAWVQPRWGPNTAIGYEHTLFSAEGRYRRPLDPGGPDFHGFSVVADSTGNWRVRLSGRPDLISAAATAVLTRTHLAVTVTSEGSQSRVRLFLNGKNVGTSDPVFYSPPTGAPLLIGVGSKQVDPTQPTVADRPVIALVQEVVLHRKALSAAEIENHVDINRAR